MVPAALRRLRVLRAPRAALASYMLGGVARQHPVRAGAPVVRHDPVPSAQPFPPARYVFVVGAVPERYGGRSASIIRKAQLFKEHAGVDSEIVMTHFSGDLEKLTRSLRERGALVPGVTMRRLQDYEVRPGGGRSHRLLNTRRRIHALLDDMVGDDLVFINVEARNIDHLLLTYENPNVQQLYVLHNPHIEPPYRDPARIERGFRPLIRHHGRVGAVVFLTNAQRADMESVLGPQDHFYVIPHAAPSGTAAPVTVEVERDADLVVMMARLEHQKRVEDAIEVFALVLRDHPGARLEIYGDGPERGRLQAEIDRRGLGASITLAGYTDNPAAVYRRAALSILTSRYEGFGLVVLESLSHGCPPVSYDIKYGPPELISHEQNGILVEDGDTAAMAAAASRLLGDHALRERLSQAALTAGDRLGAEVVVARWSALFNRLASAAWGSR